MKNTRIYFYDGKGSIENQKIALNNKKTILITDNETEFQVNDVKIIEIENRINGKVNIKLDSKGSIHLENKRFAVSDGQDNVLIKVIHTEETMKEYRNLLDKQQFYEMVDYIMEYSPNLFAREKLELKTAEELQDIKEKIFELANSY